MSPLNPRELYSDMACMRLATLSAAVMILAAHSAWAGSIEIKVVHPDQETKTYTYPDRSMPIPIPAVKRWKCAVMPHGLNDKDKATLKRIDIQCTREAGDTVAIPVICGEGAPYSNGQTLHLSGPEHVTIQVRCDDSIPRPRELDIALERQK